ncbi:MAG: histidine kinase dimerization/phosphoacceptor domain -containing protein [Salinivirgaceae bacterium]
MNLYRYLILMFFISTLAFRVNGSNDQRTLFKEIYLKANSENNKEKALKYAFDAWELAQQMNNDTLIASGLVVISNNYKSLGNYGQALTYALMAEPYYQKINETMGSAMIATHIAGIYFTMENFEPAISYYQRAMQVKTEYIALTLAIYTNLGEIYRKMQHYDSALYYMQRYLNEARDHNFAYYDGQNYANLGLVYAAQNETTVADSMLNKATDILKTNKDFMALTQTYLELSKIYLEQKDYSKALPLVKLAYQTADSNHYTGELKNAALLLAQLNEQKNNFVDAYRYLKTFNSLREQIASDSVVSKLAEMRADFEIQKKEEEVIYLKRISNIKNLLALILIIGLVAVLTLVRFLYVENKKRKQANRSLEEYNEELNQKNHIIHQALQDKEVLIREIHHRVKNNLQIISSIINLQRMRIDNPDTENVFNEMQRRIMAIASIHHKLYQGDSVSLINMKEYLTEIVESIHQAFDDQGMEVNYQISIQNIKLDIDAAVSLGLIVNELVTNAYKYAFKAGHKNHLTIGLTATGLHQYQLRVSDSGPGLPQEFSIEKSDSLGMRMVSLLTRQLKGKIDIQNQQGAVVLIDFKEALKNVSR